MKKLGQRGFTLIEIIIAMSIFSLSMVVLTMSFVGLVRTQRIAASDRATQQNARSIIEDIVRNTRSSKDVIECKNINGTDALILDRSKPLIYYRNSAGGLVRADAIDTACPTSSTVPAGEVLTADVVTADAFNIRIINDPPPPATPESIAVELEVNLVSQGTSTIQKTVASTRGDAPGAGGINP